MTKNADSTRLVTAAAAAGTGNLDFWSFSARAISSSTNRSARQGRLASAIYGVQVGAGAERLVAKKDQEERVSAATKDFGGIAPELLPSAQLRLTIELRTCLNELMSYTSCTETMSYPACLNPCAKSRRAAQAI